MNPNLEANQLDTSSTEENAIRHLNQQLSITWANGDADAFATLFTQDADYVVFDGTHLKGRKAIADLHRPLFEEFMKGSKLPIQNSTIRFLTPEIALVHNQAGILMKNQEQISRSRLSVQTLVAIKQKEDGEWRFAAFQNTRYQPFDQTLLGKVLKVVNSLRSRIKKS